MVVKHSIKLATVSTFKRKKVTQNAVPQVSTPDRTKTAQCPGCGRTYQLHRERQSGWDARPFTKCLCCIISSQSYESTVIACITYNSLLKCKLILNKNHSIPMYIHGGCSSPAVVCWASDHWVASSNPLRGKFRHYFRLIIPGVCLAQFSLNNVHKRGLKHHLFISNVYSYREYIVICC